MEALQQFLAVAVVLGLLVGVLWLMRAKTRFGVSLRRRGRESFRSIDRLALSAQHSLHLVRVGRQTLLIGVAPGAVNLIREVNLEGEPGVEDS